MKLLAEETEITDKAGAHVLCDARGEIELDHVNFTYDGKVDALKNLTVKIPAGTSVALVGWVQLCSSACWYVLTDQSCACSESGSGKSTLFRLLYRFYEVTGGAIRFDGSDIRDVTQTSLRQAIGVVPQGGYCVLTVLRIALTDLAIDRGRAVQRHDRLQYWIRQGQRHAGRDRGGRQGCTNLRQDRGFP